jgi:hypothetical protein
VRIETFGTILDHEHGKYSAEFIEPATLSFEDPCYPLFGYTDEVPQQEIYANVSFVCVVTSDTHPNVAEAITWSQKHFASS